MEDVWVARAGGRTLRREHSTEGLTRPPSVRKGDAQALSLCDYPARLRSVLAPIDASDLSPAAKHPIRRFADAWRPLG